MRTYNCICWTRNQKDIPHCKMSDLMIAPMASFIGYGCPDNEAFWGRASIKNSFGKNFDNRTITMDDFEISPELEKKLLNTHKSGFEVQIHLYFKKQLLPICGESGLTYYQPLQGLLPMGYLSLDFSPLWLRSNTDDTRIISYVPDLKYLKFNYLNYYLNEATTIEDFGKTGKID